MKKLSAAVFAVAVFAIMLVCAAGCTKKETQPQSETQSNTQTQTGSVNSMITPPGGVTELKMEDIIQGTGAQATPGKNVTVHYTGWLTDGTKFDSSKDRGQPFSFPLGAGRVIRGWDQGVAGMKVGGKRKLTIPPALAYGDRGAGGRIPPNATLVFEVELLKVE